MHHVEASGIRNASSTAELMVKVYILYRRNVLKIHVLSEVVHALGRSYKATFIHILI